MAEEEFNNLRVNFGELNNANRISFAGFCSLPEAIINVLFARVEDFSIAGRLAELRQARNEGNAIFLSL